MSGTQDWSAAQYLKFADERTRAARDLLAQVPAPAPARVVDVGCGPGNSTELLVARWPDAEVSGLDASPAMLEEARRRLPALRFTLADAATWVPDAAPDVIFANAVFQWVPDHERALARLFETLAPRGALAVQMPDNLDEPSHRLMREVAARMPFAERLRGVARDPLPPPGRYVARLAPLGARVDVWHTVYNHPMPSAEAIVEWVKGTGLRPYLVPLSPDEQTRFLDAYTRAVDDAYPPVTDGVRLLRFPRLFLVAEKP